MFNYYSKFILERVSCFWTLYCRVGVMIITVWLVLALVIPSLAILHEHCHEFASLPPMLFLLPQSLFDVPCKSLRFWENKYGKKKYSFIRKRDL